jgi:hypothetical protein
MSFIERVRAWAIVKKLRFTQGDAQLLIKHDRN